MVGFQSRNLGLELSMTDQWRYAPLVDHHEGFDNTGNSSSCLAMTNAPFDRAKVKSAPLFATADFADAGDLES